MKQTPTYAAVLLATVAFVLGTRSAQAQQAGAWAQPQPTEERRSTGKMVTGIILTSCGLVNATAGAAAFVSLTQCDGEFCGFNAIAGVAGVGVGSVLLGVGIPLWVIGAGDPEPGDSATTKAIPSVAVTPHAVAARWTF